LEKLLEFLYERGIRVHDWGLEIIKHELWMIFTLFYGVDAILE